MSAQHTPTPWWTFQKWQMGRGLVGFGRKPDDGSPEVVVCDTSDALIRGAGESEDAFVDRAQVNAEFIVRACNAHDQLLAAAKTLRQHLALFCGPDDAIANEIFAISDAAIAAAEGRP